MKPPRYLFMTQNKVLLVKTDTLKFVLIFIQRLTRMILTMERVGKTKNIVLSARDYCRTNIGGHYDEILIIASSELLQVIKEVVHK